MCRPAPTGFRRSGHAGAAPSSTGSAVTATCACTPALHLLCSLIPFPVTGGSIGAEESRLDFDISDAGAVDKDDLTERLNALVAADHPVTMRWITDEELADNPGLVRTMSVKPPTGSGRVRLVAIGADGAVDLQPCGGTHVRSTGEIGALAVTKIEKKGRQNRRIRLAFAERRMSDLLVSPEWLKEHLGDPQVKIVDASWYLPAQKRDAKAEFLAGHIPGAVLLRHRRHRRPFDRPAAHAAGRGGLRRGGRRARPLRERHDRRL